MIDKTLREELRDLQELYPEYVILVCKRGTTVRELVEVPL